MKNIVFILLILTIFSCSSKKRETSQDKSTKSEKITDITKIEFNEDIHDFGVLKSGEIVVFTFVVTNIGKHNLKIKGIETDCDCIRAKYPKTPIKPKETGLIEIEFNSSGMFGRQFKSIQIDANCKEPKHLAIFAIVKNENLEIIY